MDYSKTVDEFVNKSGKGLDELIDNASDNALFDKTLIQQVEDAQNSLAKLMGIFAFMVGRDLSGKGPASSLALVDAYLLANEVFNPTNGEKVMAYAGLILSELEDLKITIQNLPKS